MQYRNQIVATGKITQINEKDGFTQVKLITKQPGTSAHLELNMVYYGKMPDWYDNKHAFVKVTGYTESISFKDDSRKKKIRQRYVIEDFSPLQTLTMEAFGVEGKYVAPYEFRAYLSGKISEVKDDDKWIRYTLQTEHGGGYSPLLN